MAVGRRKDTFGRPSGEPVPEAGEGLASSLYQEFHKLAAHRIRFERANHTLLLTALVRDVYRRLAEAVQELSAACQQSVHVGCLFAGTEGGEQTSQQSASKRSSPITSMMGANRLFRRCAT
jgi:hypothetical protein